MATTFSQLTQNQPGPNDNFAFDSVSDGNTYRVTLNDLGATAGAHAIGTVADLQNAPTPAIATNGLPLLGYNTDLDGGGGTIVWDPDRDKQDHNGGTVFSPTWNNGTFGDVSDSNWYIPDPTDTGTGAWVRSIGSFVSPEMYGCFGDGSTNDTLGFEAMLNHHNNIVLNSHYILNAMSFEGDSYRIVGNGNAVLDFSDDTSIDPDIEFSGTKTVMADLASDVSKGDEQITFATAHNLSVGDLFIIHNPADASWSYHRPAYKKGEICKVKNVVDTTTVEIFGNHGIGTYDSYVAADVDVYRVDPVKVSASGFKLLGNEGQGLKTLYGEAVNYSNLDFEGIFLRTCWAEGCYGVTYRAISINQTAPTANQPNPSYGIHYACSQNVRISDCVDLDTFGDSIEQGNGNDIEFPSRDIVVSNISCTNNLSQHGFAQYTKYVNCFARRIIIGGRDGEVYNCTSGTIMNVARESTNANWTVKGCTVKNELDESFAINIGQAGTVANPVNPDGIQKLVIEGNDIKGLIDMPSTGSMPYDQHIKIKNNRVETTISGTHYPDYAIECAWDFSLLEMSGNTWFGNTRIDHSNNTKEAVIDVNNDKYIKGTRAPDIIGNGNEIVFINDIKVIDNARVDGPDQPSNTNFLFFSLDTVYLENSKLGDTVNNTNGSWLGFHSINNIYLRNNSSLNQETKELEGGSVGNIRSGFTGRSVPRSGTATILSGDNSVLVTFPPQSQVQQHNIQLTGTHAEVSDCVVSAATNEGLTIQTGDGSNVTADRDVYWSLEF